MSRIRMLLLGQRTVISYCILHNLPRFRLDPPRCKSLRCAVCIYTKRDVEGLHLHRLEYMEPDQVDDAVKCIRKLRKLCQSIEPTGAEKRFHAVSVCAVAPSVYKKARILVGSANWCEFVALVDMLRHLDCVGAKRV